MSYKTRNILFSIFLLIFLITTPLVSLYATGYKIGSGFSLLRTGILIVDTEPRHAQIYLNGAIQQDIFKKIIGSKEGYIQTPAKIKNLKPGKYNVRFELDGYWPWEKNLEIGPGQSTFAEDVNLFRKDLPLIILEGSLKNASLSPNKNFIVAEQSQKTDIINLETEEIKTFATETQNTESTCTWSPDEEKAVINNEICDMADITKKESLSPILGNNITNIKWSDEDKDIIFYTNGNKINYYNINQKINKTINYQENFETYLPKDKLVYIVGNFQEQSSLSVWDYTKNDLIKSIELPKSSYQFINPEQDLINLLDTKHNILYLIDPLSPIKPLYDSINGVTKAFWVDDEKILFANDFEVWLYNTKSSDKELLTRVSNKIDTIFWHPSNNYVIYSTDKNINIIELDKREKYNVTTIFENEEIKYTNINKKGNTLYFYTKIGQKEGLYKLAIQ